MMLWLSLKMELNSSVTSVFLLPGLVCLSTQPIQRLFTAYDLIAKLQSFPNDIFLLWFIFFSLQSIFTPCWHLDGWRYSSSNVCLLQCSSVNMLSAAVFDWLGNRCPTVAITGDMMMGANTAITLLEIWPGFFFFFFIFPVVLWLHFRLSSCFLIDYLTSFWALQLTRRMSARPVTTRVLSLLIRFKNYCWWSHVNNYPTGYSVVIRVLFGLFVH